MVAVFVSCAHVMAAAPGYDDLAEWTRWSRLRVGARAGLACSFDPTNGNADFSHYESPPGLQTTEVNCIVATLPGPGVIHRFWMPHTTALRDFDIRMYFDGESTPRIDTSSIELFSGQFQYFAPPLLQTCAGGQTSYEPIRFSQSLRIETINQELPPFYSVNRHYYQYSYSLLPPGTPITSHDGTLSDDDVLARERMVNMLSSPSDHPDGDCAECSLVELDQSFVAPAGELVLASLSGPGTIRAITLRPASADDVVLDALRIQVRYDNAITPAIDVPVADFFGAGHGRADWNSLPIGAEGGWLYCHWPMPFHAAAHVKLVNTSNTAIEITAASVQTAPGPVDPYQCYLHAVLASSMPNPPGYHTMLNLTGRGHYVGNLLYITQDWENFYILEGDEDITVDGATVLHGTGLEDAYNGGYYYNWVVVQPDEPEGSEPTSAIRPLSGILRVNRGDGYVHAHQYRWQIADSVPFTTSLNVRMENTYSLSPNTEWRSVAFYYRWPKEAIAATGDATLDGLVDGEDVPAFIGLLFDPMPMDPVPAARVDFNGDCIVGAEDIAPFVSALLAGE